MSLEEIKNCKYISSVGMLKRLDENEIITYDAAPDKITHNFNKLLNGKNGSIIYVKFAFIRQFIYQVLPSINYNFILVTGDGDESMPNDIFDQNTFNSIINDTRVIHWYSVNCNEELHIKFSLIPIGVNFHSLSYGEFCGWNETAITPLEQENIIENIKNNSLPFYERKVMCYSNFHFLIHNEFGNPRQSAIDNVPKDLVYYEPVFKPRLESWETQSEYAFVLSPMGHGMDCHRTWEALILGCIPVVKKSQLDSLYEGLPVLIVNEWSDITEKLLFETIDKFKNMVFEYDRITAEYWVDKIKNLK